MKACCAEGSRDARIITPALLHRCGYFSESTRATMSPSPLSGCDTKVNESATSQMSAPLPVIVIVVPERVADPAALTEPISVSFQPLPRVDTSRDAYSVRIAWMSEEARPVRTP